MSRAVGFLAAPLLGLYESEKRLYYPSRGRSRRKRGTDKVFASRGTHQTAMGGDRRAYFFRSFLGCAS